MRSAISVFLAVFCVAVLHAQPILYQKSQLYSAPKNFQDAPKRTVRYPTDVAAGSKISKIIAYPYDTGTPSLFDALPVLLQICQQQVNLNATYVNNTEVCSAVPRNTYINVKTKRSISLAADEYVSWIYLYGGDYLEYWLNHVEFRTNRGQSIGSGGSYYFSPAYYGQWGYTIQESNFSVPFGYQLAGVNYGIYAGQGMTNIQFATDKVTTCGDGYIDVGEDCDSQSPCCVNCKFAPATTVCRPSYGLCDVPENCTATSDVCPDDEFLPYGTPCGEFFGMCDVQLEKSCLGNSSQCFPTPTLPANLIGVSAWSTFNVLSFDTFSCDSGTVDGRLAAKNSINVTDFTLGSGLSVAADGVTLFSLFSAGNVSWTTGSLLPDGTNGNPALGFAAGSSDVPDYLADRFTNLLDGDASSSFDQAQAYFVAVQLELAGLGKNVDATLMYQDGLFLTCSSKQSVYHVSVDVTTFNSVNWYSTQGCQFGARWIIDITGSGDVRFQGEPFPGIVERVIYNVLGSGRIITANNGVNGHILAPKNSFKQTIGITYGQLVVKNVISSKASSKPNCHNFNPVIISLKLVRPVQLGDEIIYVADLENLIVGDVLCVVSGDCSTVLSGSYSYQEGIGLVGAVAVSNAFQSNVDILTYPTVTVTSTNSDRSTPLATRPADPNLFASSMNDATTKSLGMAVLLVISLSLVL